MLNGPVTSPALSFLMGDYLSTMRSGQNTDWQYYASLALIGRTQEAIAALEQFPGDDALFYLGVAHWMDANDDLAIRILSQVKLPHARNLLNLILKPKISVLAQSQRDLPLNDPKFELRVLGYEADQVACHACGDINHYFDRKNPPDFYLASMIEGSDIPLNIQAFPNPIFGATSEYDQNIQSIAPWLFAFDELIVGGSQEWSEVGKLTNRSVHIFPKLFALPEDLPLIPQILVPPQTNRELDLLISGSLVDPYHPERSRLIREISRSDQIKYQLTNGLLKRKEFIEQLGRSRVFFSFERHPSALPKEGLEALSMGCALLTQEGSALSFYLGEQDGVFTYTDERSLLDGVSHALSKWLAVQDLTRRSAHIVRNDFCASQVTSQYLRFLTYLAAKPRAARAHLAPHTLVQREPNLLHGPLSSVEARLHRLDYNCNLGIAKYQVDKKSQHLNSVARELVLAHASDCYDVARRSHPSTTYNPEYLPSALTIYKAAIADFPLDLAPRFNFIRAALHFGAEESVEEALILAQQTLALPTANWKIDALDDVFPWDFFGQIFNYRCYLDLCSEELLTKCSTKDRRVNLILASICFYRAQYTQDSADFKHAIQLDPEFCFYKYGYAAGLIRSGAQSELQTAGEMLAELAESSMLFVEAFKLLKALCEMGVYSTAQLSELALRMERFERCKPDSRPAEDLTPMHLMPCSPQYLLRQRVAISKGSTI